MTNESELLARPRLTWKWGRGGDTTTAYLGSAANPDATVFPSSAGRTENSRYFWTTLVHGQAVAVSTDPTTAQKVARAKLAEMGALLALVLR